MRIPEHVRRRRLRLLLFVVSTAVSLLLALYLFTAKDEEAANQLIGVVGTFAGLGSLVAAIAQFLPPPPPPADAAEAADQLAATVREQWAEEVEARQLRDPAVIPLSWAGTGRPVTVPHETIVGAGAGRVTRLALDGRLDGDFDRAASQLAADFRGIPSGRLVILGEPGAGKSVLAMMLTLGLLATSSPNAPVPVLLPVSGWDPVSESLDDFIVGSLAASYYGGHPQIPRLLLERRRLLPVLDGLDEMPEAARRNAVRGLNEACGDGRGVVVTCRSVEYQDVIEGGSPPLRKAPVVEVTPVSVSDMIAYLADVNWPEDVNWEPVYAHVRQHPDSPAAVALSTPLAISLARSVYRNCQRDPGELLGFEGRHAIEDHLVDHTILAAYAPPPGTLLQSADSEWQENAKKAERWLTFLATYLHRHRERDLAWWLMSSRLLSRWSGLLIGIATGVLVMLLILLALAVDQDLDESFGPQPKEVIWTGGVVSVLAMLTWYAAPDRRPGRISFTLRGSLHRLRGGFRTGFALTSLMAATALGIAGIITTVNGIWYPSTVILSYNLIALATGVSTTIGFAFAAHNWLNTSPKRSTRTNPTELIHQDRTSTLVTAALAGTALGITALPLVILTDKAKTIIFLASTKLSSMPPILEILRKPVNIFDIELEYVAIVVTTVLPGVIFSILMLFPRAWTRFTLVRLILAIKGQLPWNLVKFLGDARKRQLLRQANGLYQFRHIRLQERLATQSLAENRTLIQNPRTIRRHRLQIAATASALAASTLLINQMILPEDKSETVIPTGANVDVMLGPEKTHTLITIRQDGTVQRWNTRTGARTSTEKYLSPHNGLYLTVNGDGVILYASNSNYRTMRGEAPEIFKVAKIPWNRNIPVDWIENPAENKIKLEEDSEDPARPRDFRERNVSHEEMYDMSTTDLRRDDFECLPSDSWRDTRGSFRLNRTPKGGGISIQGSAIAFFRGDNCQERVTSIAVSDSIRSISINEEESGMAVTTADGETRIFTLKGD